MIRFSITSILFFGLLTGSASGQNGLFFPHAGAQSTFTNATKSVVPDDIPSFELDSGRTILFFPPGDLYPPYIADPHRPATALMLITVPKSRIPESGSSRTGLKAGGRFGIVRVHPPGEMDRGWQLSLEGGVDAVFDSDNSLDNIGWDGNYGIVWTTSLDTEWAFKLALLHTSSHIGDEYIERTGATRISYTREEFAAGISWFLSDRWRTYTEAGWAHHRSNEELQEKGRLQLGIEYQNPKRFWQKRYGWYAALDLQSWQERDWRVDSSLQAGLMMRSGCRTWRVGIEACDGRPSMGEFFQYDERTIALGLWIDM